MSQSLPEISSLNTGVYGAVGPTLALDLDLFYNKFSIKMKFGCERFEFIFLREFL